MAFQVTETATYSWWHVSYKPYFVLIATVYYVYAFARKKIPFDVLLGVGGRVACQTLLKSFLGVKATTVVALNGYDKKYWRRTQVGLSLICYRKFHRSPNMSSRGNKAKFLCDKHPSIYLGTQLNKERNISVSLPCQVCGNIIDFISKLNWYQCA